MAGLVIGLAPGAVPWSAPWSAPGSAAFAGSFEASYELVVDTTGDLDTLGASRSGTVISPSINDVGQVAFLGVQNIPDTRGGGIIGHIPGIYRAEPSGGITTIFEEGMFDNMRMERSSGFWPDPSINHGGQVSFGLNGLAATSGREGITGTTFSQDARVIFVGNGTETAPEDYTLIDQFPFSSGSVGRFLGIFTSINDSGLVAYGSDVAVYTSDGTARQTIKTFDIDLRFNSGFLPVLNNVGEVIYRRLDVNIVDHVLIRNNGGSETELIGEVLATGGYDLNNNGVAAIRDAIGFKVGDGTSQWDIQIGDGELPQWLSMNDDNEILYTSSQGSTSLTPRSLYFYDGQDHNLLLQPGDILNGMTVESVSNVGNESLSNRQFAVGVVLLDDQGRQVDAIFRGQISQVPEPSGLALIALGTLAVLRRRKQA